MPTVFSKLPHDVIFQIIRHADATARAVALDAHKRNFQATLDILNNLPEPCPHDPARAPLPYLGWFDLEYPRECGGNHDAPCHWYLPKLLVEFPDLQQEFQDYIDLW
jgi:hypothetical protein